MRTLAGLASFVVLAAVLVAAFPRAASATGPWVQTDNGYYTTARFGYMTSSNVFDAAGDEVSTDPTKYKEQSLRFDAEYGMSNKLSLLLGMPVLWKTYKIDGGGTLYNNSGFGDIDFGFKYGILSNPESKTAAAAEVSMTFPTGYNIAMGVPAMGRGRFSVLGALHAGMTFDPAPVYVQGKIGYRHFTKKEVVPPDTSKTKLVSDAIEFGVEAGLFVTPRVLLVGEYLAGNANDEDKYNFQSQSQFGGNVQYRLKPGFDITAGMRTTVSGKNSVHETSPVYKGTQFRVGIALKGNDLGRNRGQGAYGYDEKAFPNAKPRKPPAPTPAPEPVPAPAPTSAPSDTTGTPK